MERTTGPRNAVRLLVGLLLAVWIAWQADIRDQSLASLHSKLHEIFEAIPEEGEGRSKELLVDVSELQAHIAGQLLQGTNVDVKVIPPMGSIVRGDSLVLDAALDAHVWLHHDTKEGSRNISLGHGTGFEPILVAIHDGLLGARAESGFSGTSAIVIEFRDFRARLTGADGRNVYCKSDVFVQYVQPDGTVVGTRLHKAVELVATSRRASVDADNLKSLFTATDWATVVPLGEKTYAEVEEAIHKQSETSRSVALFGQAIQRRGVGFACTVLPLLILVYLWRFWRGVAGRWSHQDILETQALHLLGSDFDRWGYVGCLGALCVANVLVGLRVALGGWSPGVGFLVAALIAVLLCWKLSDAYSNLWKELDSLEEQPREDGEVDHPPVLADDSALLEGL